MNELETALKTQDWSSAHSSAGCFTRPKLDQLMKSHDPAAATALWDKYCPWSDTNGGYIAWSRR
jgi:hypothetical protein